MPLYYNGTQVKKLFYNGIEVKNGYYNSVKVFSSEPTWVPFTYTGTYDWIDYYTGASADPSSSTACLRLKTSGTIRFSAAFNADVFCVGGGSSGASNVNPSGGGGGYTNTYRGINFVGQVDYPAIVGNGGVQTSTDLNKQSGHAGETTSINNCTAEGGTAPYMVDGAWRCGGNGGSGGHVYVRDTPRATDGADGISIGGPYYIAGTGQHRTTRAFEDPLGILYSDGGLSGYQYGPVYTDRPANSGGGGDFNYSTNRGTSGGSGVILIKIHR